MFKRIPAVALIAGTLLALSSCGTKQGLIKLDAEDLLGRGRTRYEAGKYSRAADDFKEVLYNYSGTRIAAEAGFLLGECHFKMKEYETAAEDYQLFLADYPDAARADEAQIRLAQAYLKLSPHHALDQRETGERALEAIDRFFDRFPDSKLADRARSVRVEIQEKLARKEFEAGKFYAKRKLFRSARIYLEGIVNEYPDTKWAAEARTLLAGLPAAAPLPGTADTMRAVPGGRN